MKRIALFMVIILNYLVTSSCEESDVAEGTPACIKKLIREIKQEEVRNPPASVWRYDVEGTVYYYISPYCCDIPSQLYSSDCDLICHPDGGFTGRGDGNCPDLSGNVEKKLIWEDERK